MKQPYTTSHAIPSGTPRLIIMIEHRRSQIGPDANNDNNNKKRRGYNGKTEKGIKEWTRR